MKCLPVKDIKVLCIVPFETGVNWTLETRVIKQAGAALTGERMAGLNVPSLALSLGS